MTTRRDFIKKTTVGSAAITLGGFALPAVPGESRGSSETTVWIGRGA